MLQGPWAISLFHPATALSASGAIGKVDTAFALMTGIASALIGKMVIRMRLKLWITTEEEKWRDEELQPSRHIRGRSCARNLSNLLALPPINWRKRCTSPEF